MNTHSWSLNLALYCQNPFILHSWDKTSFLCNHFLLLSSRFYILAGILSLPCSGLFANDVLREFGHNLDLAGASMVKKDMVPFLMSVFFSPPFDGVSEKEGRKFCVMYLLPIFGSYLLHLFSCLFYFKIVVPSAVYSNVKYVIIDCCLFPHFQIFKGPWKKNI